MTSTTISVVARVVGRDVSSAVGEGENDGMLGGSHEVCVPLRQQTVEQSLSSTHFEKHTQCNGMKM